MSTDSAPSEGKVTFDVAEMLEGFRQQTLACQKAHSEHDTATITRVARVEFSVENIERRLNEGANTFTKLQTLIEQVDQRAAPKPLSRWQLFGFVIGPVFACAMAVAGIVWQAAKYPSRAEFSTALDQLGSIQRSLAADLMNLKIDQVQVRSDITGTREAVKRVEDAQKGMGDKLDVLLDRRRER